MNIRSLTADVDWYAVVASMADGMMVCTPGGRIMQCSKEAAGLLGKAEEDVVDHHPTNLFEMLLRPDGRQVPAEQPIWHDAEEGETFVRGIMCPDGSFRWLRFDKHLVSLSVDVDPGASEDAPRSQGTVEASDRDTVVLLLISTTQFPFPTTPSALRPLSGGRASADSDFLRANSYRAGMHGRPRLTYTAWQPWDTSAARHSMESSRSTRG